MENNNFMLTNGIFYLNTLKCLRNEYYHNDCQLCFGMCQSEAIGLFRGKIKLFEEKCINCGDCIGICPTEALLLETFDTNDFVLKFCNGDKDIIVDKVDIPSVAMLDEHLLLSIVLRRGKALDIACDNLQIADYMSAIIENAHQFLRSINSHLTISLHTNHPNEKLQRRNLFKIFNNVNNELQKEEKTSKRINEHHKLVPSKKILFKNTLKMLEIDFERNIKTNSFIHNKNINYEACTNCNDCITFCPTESLFCGSAKENIFFNSGKCIGCGICEAVCQPNAITQVDTVMLLDFAFDRATQLVQFTYATCQECKVSFVYKGGEQICPRCQQYAHQFHNMFTLAKDL